jgi:hypothetical protein
MVMNERIQNLKDKIWTEEYWTNPNTDKLLPAQLNKFAELIVRECANVANSGIDPAESHLIGNDILEHFGVEE